MMGERQLLGSGSSHAALSTMDTDTSQFENTARSFSNVGEGEFGDAPPSPIALTTA
jgi:hypothetical protein